MPSPKDHVVEAIGDQASTAVTEKATGVPAVPGAGDAQGVHERTVDVVGA